MTGRPAHAPERSDCRRRSPALVHIVAAGTFAALLSGCSASRDLPTAVSAVALSRTCAGESPISLNAAQSTVVNCDGGSGTVLAGGGASYLIVAQLAGESSSARSVTYTLTASASSASGNLAADPGPAGGAGEQPADAQAAFDLRLRSRERSAAVPASELLRDAPSRSRAAMQTVPAGGSLRAFRVLTDYTASKDVWTTVTARLAYVGTNLLLYTDTLTPNAGFSAAALQTYGSYVDRTLYPLDVNAFGAPSDVDGNGHVIMLMSPAVNAGTPRTTCYTQGYVAGFFNGEDFNTAADPNSNRGEIFYSLVADPQGRFGCVHTAGDVSSMMPAVFLHEMQHLISYARHVVQDGGKPAAGWVDEGMSLVAEELGSQYYEARCPPPACRSNPAQLLPDSSLGFARNFSLDSYFFGESPDTAGITGQTDGALGTAWRGGAWALMRWLGDHMPPDFYQRMEAASGSGIAAIESASGGQSFGTLFANFGLALYADSLVGLPRATVPAADRFASRNLRALWASVGQAYGAAFPIVVHPVSAGATPMTLSVGGMSFWRLDTPAGAAVDTLHFSAPGGGPLDPALGPQLAIFRLPPGQ
ncbi:MAG: hypothetical protein KGN74_03910 [Gemmatimonadota bacterium]|nr:hypothetical protein [Gemmatimonadota bacterium]